MKANNVDRAYALYAEVLQRKPVAMNLLVYMANKSSGTDKEPWCSVGHDVMAREALGRPKADRPDIKAVERAIADLRSVGAITTIRRASPRRTVVARTAKYRLHLDSPASIERPPLTGGRTSPTHRDRRPPLTGGQKLTGESRANGVDRGVTVTAPGVREPWPDETPNVADGIAALEAAGLRSRRFRSIPGGRTDDDVGPAQLLLPMMAAVPDLPAEPVATHPIREAR